MSVGIRDSCLVWRLYTPIGAALISTENTAGQCNGDLEPWFYCATCELCLVWNTRLQAGLDQGQIGSRGIRTS